MSKDLRELLEYPSGSKQGRGAQSSVPLAHRRSLTSPGEPKVFRVRTGYVCGLCGRLHEALDNAFECLGRCTFELRLRTAAAGSSQHGNQTRFACTACGRGYVNCEDAEQCFEKCLHRMKPTPLFEKALRKVQVRYAQRLTTHGVRALDRTDPLTEHSKILTVLTKEKEALGRNVEPGISQDIKPALANETHSQDFADHDSSSSLSETSTNENHDSLELPEDSLMSPPELTAASENSNDESSSFKQNISDKDDLAEKNQLNLESEFSAEVTNEEMSSQEDAIAVEQGALPNSARDASESMETFQGAPDSIEEAATTSSKHHMEELGDLPSFDENFSTGEQSPQESVGISGSTKKSSNAESLESLAAKLDLSESDFNPLSASSNSTKFTENASFLSDDSFGNALENASTFATAAEQPQIPDQSDADVFAMLQKAPEGEDFKLSSSHEELLQGNSVKIDTGFLDVLSGEEDPHHDATSVFLRTQDMKKSYRRNNAKYCCSACGKEYFTKDQVDVCFYSHPEEGTHEANVLLAKAKKSRNKSVA